MLGNQYAIAAKKYCAELLNEKYLEHEHIIDRLTNNMTGNDAQNFSQLMADCFAKGYIKCLLDYESSLNKMGYQVNLRQKAGV